MTPRVLAEAVMEALDEVLDERRGLVEVFETQKRKLAAKGIAFPPNTEVSLNKARAQVVALEAVVRWINKDVAPIEAAGHYFRRPNPDDQHIECARCGMLTSAKAARGESVPACRGKRKP